MKSYLSNWNFMRALRLLLGITIMVQGFKTMDWSITFVGCLFTLMPLFNVGCCGVNSCKAPVSKNSNNQTEDISYEEIR